jgi:carboxyl-terminal processing protease
MASRILAAALLALLTPLALAAQTPPRRSGWSRDLAAGAYVVEAAGSAVDPDGARISIRSVKPGAAGAGMVSSSLSADSLRRHRVVLSAELQTRGAPEGALLWLRVDGGATVSLFDNTFDRAVRGDSDWTPRSVSLPVPADATGVFFGATLTGDGNVSVRNLRITVGPAFAADSPLVPAAQDVLDTAMRLIKENALRRDAVAWDLVEPRVRALAAGAAKTSDVYPAIRYLIDQLDDHHSRLTVPVQTAAFLSGGAQNPPAETRALPDHVGYMRVPGNTGADTSAMWTYTTRTHHAIESIATSAACGWIVDLRQNTGGNMWPMLAGLRPFLGSAELGTFENANGRSAPWIAGQNVYDVDIEPPASLDLTSAWVAVLTGPRTASSGEVVAIAFRGRDHTRSFGAPTAGLSTANRTLLLPDGAALFLTTAIDVDRTGHRYGEKVDPDENVENVENVGHVDARAARPAPDPVLQAGIDWLVNSSGCAAQPR